jgi:hypothetical protein
MSENARQIEPLSSHVLANLTVEELEQRLELQLLQTPEAEDDICIVHYGCDTECSPNNPPPVDCSSNSI